MTPRPSVPCSAARVVRILIAGIILLASSGCGDSSVPGRRSQVEVQDRPIDARVLYAAPDRASVALSPRGRQLSYLARMDGQVNIWLTDVANPRDAHPLLPAGGPSVYSYAWTASGTHLIFLSGPNATFGAKNEHGPDYVLFSIDAVTRKIVQLTAPMDRRIRYFTSIDVADEVFVSPSPRAPQPRHATRINYRSGESSDVTTNSGNAPVYVDGSLEPRIATHWADSMGLDVLRRDPQGEWHKIINLNFAERLQFAFHGFDKSGQHAFLSYPTEHDFGTLFSVDLKTGQPAEIAQGLAGEITEVLSGSGQGRPVAYKTELLRSKWHVLDPAYADLFAAIAAYQDGALTIESRSADAAEWIVSYTSDIRPKRYYLYEPADKNLTLLFPESTARDRLDLVPLHDVSVRTEDGFRITGYLSLPASSDTDVDGVPDRPLPTVVWLHGGPWGRTRWEFDPWAQWLSSRGYASLSVNFRGSIGFGKRFVEAHYGEWGGAMQEDILAMVRWAIDNRITDPKSVIVAGLSHGGYATLSLLADKPEMFACGISMSGLSDLNLFIDTLTDYQATITDADEIARFDARMARERLQFGADERTEAGRSFLAARSPITRAKRFAAPLLIQYGGLDAGVVPAHSQRLADAIADNGVPATEISFPDEGHVIASNENWLALLAVSETFLAQCAGRSGSLVSTGKIEKSSMTVPMGASHIRGLAEAIAGRSTNGQE